MLQRATVHSHDLLPRDGHPAVHNQWPINFCVQIITFLSIYSFSQLKQALLRELSEETGLTFSEESLEISTLGLWEVLYIHFIFILVA